MTNFHPIDERRQLAVPGDPVKTLQFCVDHFIQCAQEAIKDHGFFYVALSGGSTPKALYQQLAKKESMEKVDWSKVVIFFSDERSVAPDNSDSNYKMALDHGFNTIPVPKEQIFRMHAEENIDANALWYENKIQEILQGRPFDYVMLGMGDDGHTASLFPGTDALHISDHLVSANYVPQKETWRMTFTYPLINSAHHIVFYVMGEGKRAMLKQVLNETDPAKMLPSARVGTKEHKALWIADDKAAAEVLA